jgi:hypothetical protein
MEGGGVRWTLMLPPEWRWRHLYIAVVTATVHQRFPLDKGPNLSDPNCAPDPTRRCQNPEPSGWEQRSARTTFFISDNKDRQAFMPRLATSVPGPSSPEWTRRKANNIGAYRLPWIVVAKMCYIITSESELYYNYFSVRLYLAISKKKCCIVVVL